MSTDDTPVPVEEGEEYTVEIADTGEEGDGVATVQDFVVLVPDAALGERVTVRIDEVQEDFARGEAVKSESDVS
ncbi:TRAM domain-containing protein [Halostella pelagica]|uniref:TRAM domain-containing protein n=1 Tax=Halostella pelagica TaxID=2583824 RepID=UPI00107FE9C9|nr:TRAM domain-containing protein [Halostella pelagica]